MKYVSSLSDQEQIAANLTNFIGGFSATARESSWTSSSSATRSTGSMKGTSFTLSFSKFTEIDLHPDVVDNIQMGYIFRNSSGAFRSLE